MKIVCLVKQVPRPDSIEFDAETKQLRREGVPLLLNPFDAAAVVHATAHENAEVIAMTMGPPQAEAALRACLALGADRCIHLSDRVFAVADTLGTSRTLALAIQKEGDVDLVVCGRKTTDSETWQVPPETAAFLGWPHLTSVVDTEVRDGILRATRETDDGYDTWELSTPSVVSLAYCQDNAYGEADGRIDTWTATDLVDDLREHDKRFGQTGSPTRVLAVRDVTPDRAGARYSALPPAVDRVRALAAERGPEPTSWDKPARLGEQPSPKQYDCWTFIELAGDRPARVSLELLAKGRELSGKLGGDNVALVFGPDVSGELARHGADRVVLVDVDGEYDPLRWSAALRQVLEQRRPHVLLIPATANGRDLGPRVAGELELGMTGDCVGLGIDRAGRLVQTKPVCSSVSPGTPTATSRRGATGRPNRPIARFIGRSPRSHTVRVAPTAAPAASASSRARGMSSEGSSEPRQTTTSASSRSRADTGFRSTTRALASGRAPSSKRST